MLDTEGELDVLGELLWVSDGDSLPVELRVALGERYCVGVPLALSLREGEDDTVAVALIEDVADSEGVPLWVTLRDAVNVPLRVGAELAVAVTLRVILPDLEPLGEADALGVIDTETLLVAELVGLAVLDAVRDCVGVGECDAEPLVDFDALWLPDRDSLEVGVSLAVAVALGVNDELPVGSALRDPVTLLVDEGLSVCQPEGDPVPDAVRDSDEVRDWLTDGLALAVIELLPV